MAERKIQIIKLSVRKALPVIAFFLSSFFIVYFLFGVHYLLVVPPLAAFFSSWKRKDEKGVRRYIILLIHETILLFLASLGTANIVMMVFLNIAVPFILVFTQSTQFDKRGYYAYMLFFVYISFVPPVNAEDFLRMLAAIWVVTLYMGIVLFLLAAIHRQKPEEKILMKYVLKELSELTLLLTMPERKEELRLRFSELLYRKTAERQGFSAISTRETKLDDMLSTLLQRYSFMVMDEDWYSELDSQRIAELRRLASFLSETAKSIGTSWQDMQIEAAHEILETMNIPEGRIRIFIRSILHMVDFMLNTASDTELQKRKRINWRNLRHEIAIRLTSEGFELRFASRLAAVMALSGLINYLIPTVNSYWIPLNAFMLLQTSTSESSYYMKTNPIGIIAGCLVEYIVYPFLPGLWGELLFALLMISMMYASKPGSWLYPAFHTCYTLTIALMTLDESSAIGLRLLYLLIGMIGLPVFSGYTGGAGRLLGPTGGYLVGFAFLVLIAGCFTGRFSQDRWKSRLWAALGMVLGTAVLYFLGTFWLACLSGISFYEALWAGVIPFIPGDIVKILAAVLLGTPLRGRLIQAGFLTGGALEKH